MTDTAPVQGVITPPAPTANPADVYLARLAPTGRRSMRSALNRIAALLAPGTDARAFPWARLRYEHTAALRTKLAEDLAPATVNRMLSALRGTLRECWRLGLMSVEEQQRAADLAPVRGSRLPHGRALARAEVTALLAACAADPSPAGRRDAAMVAVLFSCGLRRAELVGLAAADYSAPKRELRVRAGKGNKDRLGYLTASAAAALDAWLGVRGEDAGPLFCRVRAGGRLQQTRLSPQTVADVLRRRAGEAGVAAFAPHDLRRTFATTLFQNGVDVGIVQRLMGHANVQTSLRYDRRGEETTRRAVDVLDL